MFKKGNISFKKVVKRDPTTENTLIAQFVSSLVCSMLANKWKLIMISL